MKLPSFRRLFTQDFPQEFRSLIDTLSVSLNNGIEVLYSALNKQITLQDNIKCTVRDISIVVNSNGVPTQNSSFLLDVQGKVSGCMVISALNQSNSSTYPTGGIFLSFTQNGTSVIINNITGLQANQTYLLKIVAFSE